MVHFPGADHGLWEPEFSEDGLRLYFAHFPFGPRADLYFVSRKSESDSFADQRAEEVPLLNEHGRSDRGASVLTDADGNRWLFHHFNGFRGRIGALRC